MDYDDRGLAPMPKLVGGPKYSRPPTSAAPKTDRPPDPDDLPLVSAWTDEDHAIARELGLETSAAATGSGMTATLSIAAVSSAPSDDAVRHAAGHPTGSWSASSGSAPTTSSSRRGIGGLLRGRNGRSGAG